MAGIAVANIVVPDKDPTCMGHCSLLTCHWQLDLDTGTHNYTMDTTHTTRS